MKKFKQFGLILLTVITLSVSMSYFDGSTDFPLFSDTWFTWTTIISLITSTVIWIYFFLLEKISTKFHYLNEPIFTIFLTILFCVFIVIFSDCLYVQYPYEFLLSILSLLPLLILIMKVRTDTQVTRN